MKQDLLKALGNPHSACKKKHIPKMFMDAYIARGVDMDKFHDEEIVKRWHLPEGVVVKGDKEYG